jgi:TRAP-type C4-dicarboxylate transport system permease large subunit
VIGVFVYKETTFKGLFDALKNTALDNGVIMLIIVVFGAFGYAMTYANLPLNMATGMLSLSGNSTIILLFWVSYHSRHVYGVEGKCTS